MKYIQIKGARIHNLKSINVSIPKDKLVVVTGVSGSGKSSLVFDIIFEEGKRQYLQSIGMIPGITEEDKFDQIAGIGPTVAVQQAIIRQSNPRSMVGTKTKILTYLGMLYAREGRMACSLCGTTISSDLVCERCGNAERDWRRTRPLSLTALTRRKLKVDVRTDNRLSVLMRGSPVYSRPALRAA